MSDVAIILSASILMYGFILALYIPSKYHLLINSIVAVLAISIGHYAGLSFDDMGLGVHFILSGMVVAGICSVAVMLLIAIGSILIPDSVLHKLTPDRISKPSKVAYETAVRIPLSTALSEEVLFRGVLLGVFMQITTPLMSILSSSLIFGIWHIGPALRDFNKISVVPIVIATAIAGMFFCWLQFVSNSIIAPWLVHWTINSSVVLGLHFAGKKIVGNKGPLL